MFGIHTTCWCDVIVKTRGITPMCLCVRTCTWRNITHFYHWFYLHVHIAWGQYWNFKNEENVVVDTTMLRCICLFWLTWMYYVRANMTCFHNSTINIHYVCMHVSRCGHSCMATFYTCAKGRRPYIDPHTPPHAHGFLWLSYTLSLCKVVHYFDNEYITWHYFGNKYFVALILRSYLQLRWNKGRCWQKYID